MRNLGLVLVFVAATLISSCAYMPQQGPLKETFDKANTSENDHGFILISASNEVMSNLRGSARPSLVKKFGNRQAVGSDLLGAGDVLNVTVWEPDPNGLFSSATGGVVEASSSGTEIKGLEIDSHGNINFPYIGTVHASGHRISALTEIIKTKLSTKTSDPQIHIQRVKKISNSITVIGGVQSPGLLTILPGSTRLLDLLAQAGGSKYPEYESKISVTRKGRVASVFLDSLLATPSENINILPNDTIAIIREVQSYIALGALEKKGKIDFELKY